MQDLGPQFVTVGRPTNRGIDRQSPARRKSSRQAIRTLGLTRTDRRTLCRLFFALDAACRCYAEPPHLPVKVASLDAEHFGRARDVAVLCGQRPEDVFALEP